MAQVKKRILIDALISSGIHSKREVAKVAGVSLATVYNVMAKKKSASSLTHRKGAGGPGCLRNSIRRIVSQQIRRTPYLSSRNLASQPGVNASFSTVCRALSDLEYSKKYPDKTPMLSEKNRLYCIVWAKKYMYPKKSWMQTIFLDEMSIWLSRGRIKMWTKSGKKRFAPTTKHTPKINVWATFSSMGTFPLYIFTDNMNSDMFIHILKSNLLVQAEVFHLDQWRLVMDNDPKHKSKKVQDFLHGKMPIEMPWPSQSPDLNPIENLFGWLKQELLKTAPKTISAMKVNLEKIWNSIDSDFLRPYCESMTRRCKTVIENEGYPIKY